MQRAVYEVMLWIPWCKSIPQEWTFGLGCSSVVEHGLYRQFSFGLGCSSVVEHGPYRQFTFGLGLSSLVEPGLPSSLFFIGND